MHNKETTSQEVVIRSGRSMQAAFGDYLAHCGESESFPNLAGFCRFCGIGEDRFARLRQRWPEACDFVITALEDEALNADLSSSLVTAYLKHRLGYGEVSAAGEPELILVDRTLNDDGR